MRTFTPLALTLLAWNLSAQQNRVVGNIDTHRTVTLRGNVSPEAQPQYDQGPADPGLKIGEITLVLKKSPAQQAALEKLLADQQDASSPDYHKWLTPQQYADRFGASRSDMAKIADWLTSEGFTIDYQAQGRNWVLFHGTAQQVGKTFGTEIHMYRVDGETHYANATDPSIPAALEPLALAVMGLDDFRPKRPGAHPALPSPGPSVTYGNGVHYLVPGDIAKIYDIAPLWAQGIDGTGVKIAVIGQSDINISDVSLFRSHYGLPKNDPQKLLVPGLAAPAVACCEANLDVEWSGAVAPNASLTFVYAHGAGTAAFYAIDQNLAPIITYSFYACEAKISSGSAGASANQAEAQKGNAEGITWAACTADSGAAGCSPKSGPVQEGLAVSSPSTIPEVTAVGGTEFNEGSGTYWSSSNASDLSSALGYIPEKVWNDSAGGASLSSTGGGVSIYYPKPAWQTGPGVPNDQHRDVPDISFTASAQHDGYYYVDSGAYKCCIGGTSASTPVFAGVLALLNQYLTLNGAQSQPGLGNINPRLYTLAQTNPGIFHDITVGSNIVPCVVGTKDCPNGTLGYSAGPGYDLATGLGSADVYNLVTQWNALPPAATTTTVAASPAGIAVTASTKITATVKANTGTSTPTGSVSFTVGSTTLGAVTLAGSGGTAAASITVAGNQLAVGNNKILASFGGSAGFNPSSASVTIAVTVPATGSAVIPSVTPNPVYQQTPDADGYSWFYTVNLTEIAGVATTVTGFSIGGADYSSSIASFFGSASLPAKGTLSASLRTALASVPATMVFAFSGADASGVKWNQQISVSFYGPQLAASMVLSSSPAVAILNPNSNACPADYPYYQELNLQELNGYEVYLTNFFAGGNDDSDSIEYWFGSWRLAPLGSLQADICWAIDGPQTLNFEVDGIDSQGNAVTTALSVPFQNPTQSPGKLSTSPGSLNMTVKSGQSASASLQVSVPAGQQWTLSVFPANQQTSWLSVSPLSGTGAATVSVKASGAGLANGAYTALLVFQSVNTMPQFVNVLVLFANGLSSTASIGGVTNGASFQQAAAPGMIMSVFGTNLAKTGASLSAAALPLPLALGGVTATVNGVPAPFYYASPGQLNIQLPYETPVGNAILNVNNNGQVAAYSFPVSDSAPGIFVGAGNALVPFASGHRGQTLVLFMTGEGDSAPFIATGASPPLTTPVDQLPSPILPYSLTVGGVAVTPDFIGIPYYLVGVTQINFTIPQNAPLGTQPVVVTVGDNGSVAATITVLK
ncbi:MAG TPA: protease pro-enzyme activation domain-containing protein [Bryobacteraceae bacterium]|nr:protease pro-enzyme activation domain-containing protein [Bryobacteraceae bacterium]